MANSVIKPLPLMKGLQPLNTEAVDGMAQQGTATPQQEQAKPKQQIFSGGPAAPQTSTAGQDQTDVLNAAVNWGHTQVRDLWSIVENIPTIAAQAWKNTFPDISDPLKGGEVHQAMLDLWQYWKEDPDAVKDVSYRVIKDLLTSNYQDENGRVSWGSFWRGARDHTALTALDALGVVGLAGSAASKTSKLARALKLGTTVTKDLKGSGIAGQLERIGGTLLDIEMAPWKGMMLGLKKLEKVPPVSWIEKGLRVTPIVRDWWSRRGTITQKFNEEALAEQRRLTFDAVPTSRHDDLADIMDYHKDAIRSEWDDKSWAAITEWDKQQSDYIQWLKKSGAKDKDGLPINEEWARQAAVKKIISRNRQEVTGILEKYRSNGGDAWLKSDEGRAAIAELQKPHSPEEQAIGELIYKTRVARAKAEGLSQADFHYRPWLEEGGTSLEEIIETLGEAADVSLKRKIGTMERLIGRPLKTVDPHAWASRAIAARALMKSEVTFLYDTAQRHGKLLAAGERVPEGYKELPPWMDHYLRQSDMAMAKWGADKADVVRAKYENSALPDGTLPQEVMRDVIEDVGKILDDPETGFRAIFRDSNKRIAVPEDIANAMIMDMQKSGGFGYHFEKATNFWKQIIFLVPRFYFNNIVGNTLLTILHGVSPAGKSFSGMRVPASVNRAMISMADSINPLHAASARRWIRKAAEAKRAMLDQPQDAIFRRTIFDREVQKALESRSRVLALADSIGEARLKEIMDSSGGLANAMMDAHEKNITARAEQMARLELSHEDMKEFGATELTEAATIRLRNRIDDLDRKMMLVEANDGGVPAARTAKAIRAKIELEYNDVVRKTERSLKRIQAGTRRQDELLKILQAASDEQAGLTMGRINATLEKTRFALQGERARHIRLIEAGKELQRSMNKVDSAVSRYKSLRTDPHEAMVETFDKDINELDRWLNSQEDYMQRPDEPPLGGEMAFPKEPDSGGGEPLPLLEPEQTSVQGQALPVPREIIESTPVATGESTEILGSYKSRDLSDSGRSDYEIDQAELLPKLVERPPQEPPRPPRRQPTPEPEQPESELIGGLIGEKQPRGEDFMEELLRPESKTYEGYAKKNDLRIARLQAMKNKALERLNLAESAIRVRGAYAKRLATEVSEAGRIRQMAQLSEPIEEAVRNMERFLGAYGKLTPFERQYLRRWMNPFWTFQKTIFGLMWQLPLLRPGATVLFHRVAQLALESFDDDRLPSSLKGYILLGSTRDGRLVFARADSWNPFSSGAFREIGRVPIPKLMDPFNNPVVSIIHRGAGGYDSWDQPQPVRPDEEFMDAGGRVWRWDPYESKAVQVSPSRNLFEMTAETVVPQWGMLNDILAGLGFQMPGPGPKLYKSPDGSIVNPRHTAWALGRMFGAPVQSEELWRVEARERVARYNFVKNVAKAVVRLRQREPKEFSFPEIGFYRADSDQAIKVLQDVLQDPEFKMVR